MSNSTTTPMNGKKNQPPSTKGRHKNEIRQKLCAEAMHEGRPLAIGSIALILSTLSNQALMPLMGTILDLPIDEDIPFSTMSSFMIVVLGGGLSSFLRTTMFNQAKQSMASRLRRQAFASIMTEKNLEWHQTATIKEITDGKEEAPPTTTTPAGTREGVSPAAISVILTEDVTKISNSLTSSVTNLLRSSSSIIFSTYHMINLNPALFGVSISVIPMIGATAMLISKSIKRLSQRQRQLATDSLSFVEERLVNISMVHLCNRQDDEVDKYIAMQEEHFALDREISLRNGYLMGFLFIASSGALALVVGIGGKAVQRGRMTAGQLALFATNSFLLGVGTSGIVSAMGELVQGITSAERYYQLFGDKDISSQSETEDEIDMTEEELHMIDSISLVDVCFSYQSTGKEVLHAISFKVERGKAIALVGKNGSGKSTTASILAGLLKPHSGQIILSDGTDMTKLSKNARKTLIQVVPQSNALFNMSIFENVRYGKPDATEEEVTYALKHANCDNLLSKLEGGMHYVVGLNGDKLSGGERKRVALARAFLSDPCVLVMDEPGASLDVDGENAVAEAIMTCRNENRALLLISHHAKSLSLVDEVLVMKDGAIVESGPFQTLRADSNSDLCRLMPDLIG